MMDEWVKDVLATIGVKPNEVSVTTISDSQYEKSQKQRATSEITVIAKKSRTKNCVDAKPNKGLF